MVVNSLRNITDTDTFTSPALQSDKGAQRAYTIYAVRMHVIIAVISRIMHLYFPEVPFRR